MANNYKGSSRFILTYFEFRSKPPLITVICMDPRPTNYLRQNIFFSCPEMIRVSFSLFLSFSVFCYFTLLLVFEKIYYYYYYYYYIFFTKIIFIFSCSGMFRNVPCSGFYRRPLILNECNLYCKTVKYCFLFKDCMIKTVPNSTVSPQM